MATKMIYLAKRNPLTTHEEFIANWHQHAELSGQFTELVEAFRGVVQCNVIQDPDIVPGSSLDYDGANLVTMRDLASAVEVWDHPDAVKHMLVDERRVFSTLVREFSVYAFDEVVVDVPRSPYIALRFLRRQRDISREEFAVGLSGAASRSFLVRAAKNRSLRRVVHNFVVLDPPPGYEYDAVEELWFDTAEDMHAFFTDDETAQFLASQDKSVLDAERSVLVAAKVGLAVPRIRPAGS